MGQAIRARIQHHGIPVILLFGFLFLVYAGSLDHRFLLNWDDSLYVVDNPTIYGMSGEHLKEAFTQFYVGNYAPLQIISYMLDYAVWGLNPGGFVFTNLLLHGLNSMLFYLLLSRLTRRRRLGLLAAFIFLMHPVQVESVVWISQRKNLLAMLFFLGSLHLYIASRTDMQSHARYLYILSFVTFVLALLAKSVAVILPLVLLLVNICYRKTIGRIAWQKWMTGTIPFFIAAGAAFVLALNSQAPEHNGGRVSYDIEGPLSMFYTMLTVLVRYFGNLFWPDDALSALYMPPMKLRMDAIVVWSAAFALFLVLLGIYLFRKRKDLFFWYALFFAGLLPVSQIISLSTLMNDRYLYFPLLGGAACYGYCAFPPGNTPFSLRQQWISAILCLLVLPLPVLSWQRTAVWKDDVSLWSDVARKTPGAPLAWTGLGVSYFDAGQYDKVAEAYLKALSLDPDDMLALNNLGAFYNSRGKVREARPYLVKVTELFPEYLNGVMNLGINYYLSGDYQNAERTFKKALALQPRSTTALTRMGDVYLQMRKLELARRAYEDAIISGGATAYLQFSMARVASLGGRLQEALAHLESAFNMGYNDSHALATDVDLDPLRGRMEFQVLMGRYSSRVGTSSGGR